MKKYFILFICFLFLIENRNGNREKIEKLDELTKKLEEAARNGDTEAEAELKEWHKTALLIEGTF